MKSDPDEIHFDCPKCNRPMSGDKALLGETINCPDCGEAFNPTPRKPNLAAEPPKQLIGIVCPKCHRIVFVEKKAKLNELADCRDCGSSFSPVQPATAPMSEEVSAAAAMNAKLNAMLLTEMESRRSQGNARHVLKIRRQAVFFMVLATLFGVIALLTALGSAFISISGESAGDGFIVAGGFISASLWFYFIAQIVHIRANTEK